MKKITNIEAFKKLMEDNGGVASWGYIYENIERYKPDAKLGPNWQAVLRGTLYNEIKNGRNFQQTGLATFALLDYEQEKQINEIKRDEVRMHSYIEGIMVELGKYEGFDTYCADSSKEFQKNIRISEIATVARDDFPPFTYPEINKIAKEIDVIWFNRDKPQFPRRAIEVVDSITTLSKSLNRLYQLQDIREVEFWLLCPKNHQSQVQKAIESKPYSSSKDRFFVRNYDEAMAYHSACLNWKRGSELDNKQL